MKTFLLPIVWVSLWLIVAGHRSEAAPGPAHLSEVATLEVGGPSQSLAFSPDGKILFAVVGSPFSKARSGIWLWDVTSRKHIATLEPDPEMHCVFSWIDLSPDGRMAACLCGRTRIVLWDVANRKRIGSLEDNEEVYSVVFSPDGKTLSACARNSLRIWDVEKRKRVRICKTNGLLFPVRVERSIKRPVLANTNVIRPRRPGESSETVPFALVDAFTGESVLSCELEKKSGILVSFAINPAETIVASSGLNSPVHLWDRTTGKSIAIFKHPVAGTGGLAFSPDGKILASGHLASSLANSLLLFEVPSGKILAESKEFGGRHSLAFSPDGRLLAIGDSTDLKHGSIKLWSIPDKWRETASPSARRVPPDRPQRFPTSPLDRP